MNLNRQIIIKICEISKDYRGVIIKGRIIDTNKILYFIGGHNKEFVQKEIMSNNFKNGDNVIIEVDNNITHMYTYSDREYLFFEKIVGFSKMKL